MTKTKIEWSDEVWNPVTGCEKVSPGCDHCYAERFTERFRGKGSFANVRHRSERLHLPLTWRRPRRVFVNSMSDLFHDDVPDEFIAEVFAVMSIATQHTFQILTKRHARMRSLLSSVDFVRLVANKAADRAGEPPFDPPGPKFLQVLGSFPLPNVWLGVSVENQQWADIRIPALLDTPAAVRFLSCEPLLGPVSLRGWTAEAGMAGTCFDIDGQLWHKPGTCPHCRPRIDWVIVGGESGPGARPMHPQWTRDLRDQCVSAGVPFFFKQRGEWTWNEPDEFRVPTKPYSDRVAVMHAAGMVAMTKSNPFNPFERGHRYWTTRIERVGKKAAGRLLDGRTWDEYPETSRV